MFLLSFALLLATVTHATRLRVLESATNAQGSLKVLTISYNSEAAGPEAFSWLPGFLMSEEAGRADVVVGCQQEGLNDADYFADFPLTFPDYLDSIATNDDVFDDAAGLHERVHAKWKRLGPTRVPLMHGLIRDNVLGKVPHHEVGPGYICGQETRDRFAGSCQFMSLWHNTAKTGGLSLHATPPARVATSSGWTDAWKNKGILASTLFHGDHQIAKLMCTHLPPQKFRSSYMRLFQELDTEGGVLTLTGDMNYRPSFPSLLNLLGVTSTTKFGEPLAKHITKKILANKQDMSKQLVALQNCDRLSVYQSDGKMICNSPASSGVMPTYARFYEDVDGQIACKCFDAGLYTTSFDGRLAVTLDQPLCRDALVKATAHPDVQRVFGDAIVAQKAEDVVTWCTDSDNNCLALLAYRCYFQNEIDNGTVKTKQEKATYSTDGSNVTDGPMEVSTMGYLDRTCWRGPVSNPVDFLPAAYGGLSPYASDHQPTATLLTISYNI